MPWNDDAKLDSLIVRSIRGYGIVVVAPDRSIVRWLGDASDITGYSPGEALEMSMDRLFTQADVATGAPARELEIAARDGQAEDSRWHKRKDGGRFWANGLTVPLDGPARGFLKIFRDETPAKEAEDQRILLLNELNHRVKNTLATVQSVVEQTLRAAGASSELRRDLANRLVALSQAHNVLVEQNWAGADLHSLIRGVFQAYERPVSPFHLDGPSVRLHPAQAVSLSLALHELTTNAVKYGALSRQEGRVALVWNLAHSGKGDRFLNLLWAETGGPPAPPPGRTGFGSRLIKQTFGSAGGDVVTTFDPEGVRCSMSLPLVDRLPAGAGDAREADAG